MLRGAVVLLGLAALLVPLGCEREPDPPPRFSGQGGSFPRIRVRERVGDNSILGPAASADKPRDRAGGGEGEPGEAPIEIDDSTPDGVVEAYVDMVARGQFSQLPDILVPEQQEAIEAFADALELAAELNRVLENRFPGHAIRLGAGGPLIGELDFAKRLTVVEIKVSPDNEDEAEATIEDEASSQRATLLVQRIDGRWRIRDPRFRGEVLETARPVLGALAQAADELGDLAGRIEDGEIKDEQAAQEALNETVARTSKITAGAAEGTSERDDERAPEGEPKPSPRKPEPRQREAVDEVYSGPGMLRAR